MIALPNNLLSFGLLPDFTPASIALLPAFTERGFDEPTDSSVGLSGLAPTAQVVSAQQLALPQPGPTVIAPTTPPAASPSPADLAFQSGFPDQAAGLMNGALFNSLLDAAAAFPVSPAALSAPQPVGAGPPSSASPVAATAPFSSAAPLAIPPAASPAAVAPATAGPANFSPPAPQGGSQQTNMAVSADINPAVQGQTVTFTVGVGGSGPAPTGTVTLMEGQTALSGAIQLTANGSNSSQASVPISFSTTGTHNITAAYSGDSFYAAGSSMPWIEMVNPGQARSATTTTLTSSRNPSAPNYAVTFTAYVSSPNGGAPTGMVAFNEGATTLGTGTLGAYGQGSQATFVTSSLALGDHSITASYNGDSSFLGSTSATLTQTVKNPPVVVNPGGQSNVVGDTVFLPITASDANPLTYSAVGLPAGLSIDPGSGIISGTVAVGADNGSPYNVTVTAADGTLTTSQTFAWTVAHFSIPNPGDQTNAVGDSVYVPTGGSDADGDTLTFSASNLPPGLSVASGSGLITGTVSSAINDGVPYAVTLTASDGAHTASQTFNWTVTHVFVVNPGAQTNADGDNVILPINAGENNGTAVTVTAVGLPPGLSVNAANNVVGTISNTADTNSPYSVTVTATDGTYSANQTFQWIVRRLTVSNPGDQTNYDGDVVSLQISATDNLGDTLAYTAAGLPSGLSINSSTGLITGTVASAADANGPYTVTVTATGGGVSASQTFTWTVNNPVSVSPLFNRTNALGDVVSVAVSATTTTGHSLSYSATSLPPGVTINSSTGLISGTISNMASISTPYDVTVTVNDGAISANAYFVWTVGRLTLTNPGDQTNASGDTVSLTLTVSDNQGDTLSYTAAGLPPGLSINSTTGLISGVISLTADAGGPYTTTVSVSGGGAAASQNFTWNVARILITDPGTQNSADNDVVSLRIGVTDHNLDALTYSATGLPPGLSINAITGLISGTISSTADLDTPYTVTFTASDANGHSASDTFFWSVTQLTLTNPGTQLNADGDTVTLALAANGPLGVALTYSATGLPPGLSINPGTGVISGLLAMTADVSGPYTVTVTAADGRGASASQTFVWNVAQITLTNPGDQTYAANQAVTLALHADDNDGTALTYSVMGLPAGLSLSGTSIVGTVPASDVSATPYNIAVSVIDALGRTASVNFVIRVVSYTVTFTNTTTVFGGVPGVQTGYLMGANGQPSHLLHPVYLSGTISDVSRAPYIQFVPTGQGADRISLGQIHWAYLNGVILPLFSFEVDGRSETPNSEMFSTRTHIEAQDNGAIKASVPVYILVPFGIRRPAPQADQIVTGKAMVVNAASFPAFPNYQAPNVLRITGYFVTLDIFVVDQFGTKLNAFYAGASVFEKPIKPVAVAQFYSINQTIRADGSYPDTVGNFIAYYHTPVVGLPEYYPAIDPTTPAGGIAKTNWLGSNGQPLLAPLFAEQTIAIKVGGHVLTRGVQFRKVTATTAGRITIDWDE